MLLKENFSQCFYQHGSHDCLTGTCVCVLSSVIKSFDLARERLQKCQVSKIAQGIYGVTDYTHMLLIWPGAHLCVCVSGQSGHGVSVVCVGFAHLFLSGGFRN